ncbi:MAG: DEAD/DEAH box helicase [Xanthomonadales bacterium]|nr:DEAD/DEAH box helicase [Xanthomonadales bacterium]NNL94542.1 DEAD/DEAH box helicase [Xanthomonadales bacterium]
MSFESLGLSAEILRAVSEQGYSEPTPVQAESIPAILAGRDVLAGAQTGTGKTAGFTLPILQGLIGVPRQARPRTRVLILTPTRELAAQVHESVRSYAKYLDLKSSVIFGGVNINPQIRKLSQGVDILVATPGRLLDHVSRKTLDLSSVDCLVLDEADRMLDMGFVHDIRRIISLMPETRQNLMFSATYSKEIRKLADSFLNRPVNIAISTGNTAADGVTHVVHPVDKARKREMLSHMIGSNNWRQVLVFTRTKHGANRLARQMAMDGISTAAIHGNKSQGARTRALADFKRGEVRALVATDIAARGLDIEDLPHVVNYELPNVPEDYIHRIGRTGRAGQEGKAVSLVCIDEAELLGGIEKLMKKPLRREIIEGYEPDPSIKPSVKTANGRRSRNNRSGRSQPARNSSSRRGNGRRHSRRAA